MKKKLIHALLCLLVVSLLASGCTAQNLPAAPSQSAAVPLSAKDNRPEPPAKPDASGKSAEAPEQGTSGAQGYTLEQAMSDKAQLSTIAFSALAFLTGNDGADTFMPPGKVADFFGFQYMRDVDQHGYGHNTTFLSNAANNVLKILTDSQKAQLVMLAKSQEAVYAGFVYNRFPMMQAFRRSLENQMPAQATSLDTAAVQAYTGKLYAFDAQLSYERATTVGAIIASFSDEQKAYLEKMAFDDSSTWPDVQEDDTLKRSMTNTQFVAVMTYASELFSWYKGSVDADTYFCPERHGTYFGGFYMKDYPAMNNPDYFISTSLTGESGEGLLKILSSEQQKLITGIIDEQRSALGEIAQIRRTVSEELRKAMTGGTVDKAKVYSLIERYGELDGQVSCLYAQRFSEVNRTLTDAQRTALTALRNQDVLPEGAYFFSTPVDMPAVPDTDFFFGTAAIPADAGAWSAPASFSAAAADVQPPKK
jgi:Spy/CpxP family protein refolding chaperone